MSNKQKFFGTDGIRGRVGESLINPEFVLKLGWAIGTALKDDNGDKILIGKDTRVSGYLLESVLEAGLTSAGINAHLLGPMPTPAISYLTRTLRAKAGIVISASHNPFYDNGIKVFSAEGTKLPDALEQKIEYFLQEKMRIVDAKNLGKAKRINDAQGRYIEFCKGTLGLQRNLRGLKIVLDCANGATYKVAPAVFSELGADVIEIGTNPDGFNINENCGSTSPKILSKIVKAEQADLGIAFDGDGDRVIMVDDKGEIVDGDELVFVMANHGFATGSLTGGIVGTVMSNFGLEVALQNLDIPFIRTKVGDRHVLEALQNRNWQLGGESSGHIVHLGITKTGDGIVSALQVLNAIMEQHKTLHELKSLMSKMPQTLINVPVKKPCNLDDFPIIAKTEQELMQKFNNKGRILIRPSGTEPVVRVMVEGDDMVVVNEYAEILANVIKDCV